MPKTKFKKKRKEKPNNSDEIINPFIISVWYNSEFLFIKTFIIAFISIGCEV